MLEIVGVFEFARLDAGNSAEMLKVGLFTLRTAPQRRKHTARRTGFILLSRRKQETFS